MATEVNDEQKKALFEKMDRYTQWRRGVFVLLALAAFTGGQMLWPSGWGILLFMVGVSFFGMACLV